MKHIKNELIQNRIQTIKETLDKISHRNQQLLTLNDFDEFSKLIENVIWGEKNNLNYFEILIQHNLLDFYVIFLEKYNKTNLLHLNVLKSISFLIANIQNLEYMNYIFQHFCINEILKFEFDI